MIEVLVVDDSGAVRKSVRTLLDATPDIEVIGEASNGVDAVSLARELRPDVVLMDLRMPGGGGFDAIEALSGVGVPPGERIAVIAYTSFHLDEYVYGALERGAVGFLLKKNPGSIPDAIRAAVNAGALHSPAVRKRLMAGYARGTRTPQTTTPGTAEQNFTEQLTERELEIIVLLPEGLSNKQIAARLNMGESTVKWHLTNMLDKTGASNRAQLAAWAMSRGLNAS